MILELSMSSGQFHTTIFLSMIWLLTGQRYQHRWILILSWQSASRSTAEEARSSLTWCCSTRIALVEVKNGARIGTEWYTYNPHRRHALPCHADVGRQRCGSHDVTRLCTTRNSWKGYCSSNCSDRQCLVSSDIKQQSVSSPCYIHFTPKMQVINPITATIFRLYVHHTSWANSKASSFLMHVASALWQRFGGYLLWGTATIYCV
jgi:hypothetical protein